MNKKSIYIALMSLPLTCGISKGTERFCQLSLTDKENQSSLAQYRDASAKTSNFGGFDPSSFSGYTETTTQFLEAGSTPKGKVALMVQAKYSGNDPSELSTLQENIRYILANPGIKLGTSLGVSNGVKATPEDEIYLNNLRLFVVDNLFVTSYDNAVTIKPAKFKEQCTSPKRPFKYAQYQGSPLLYTSMYYFDDPQAEPVNITRDFRSYNNLKFELSPCAAVEDGTKLNFSFERDQFNMYSPVQLDSESNDTLSKTFSSMPFFFRFGLYKLAEATYRMNVTMSTLEGMFEKKLTPQKISNITVKITK